MDLVGGQYDGDLVSGMFEGEGTYTFPNGARSGARQKPPPLSPCCRLTARWRRAGDSYKGSFKRGRFHGEGRMTTNGAGSFTATWQNGEVVEGTYTFADGLEYRPERWPYCTQQDRRFHSEIQHGIKPAGDSQLTDRTDPSALPQGTYDVGTGYFDPSTGAVHDVDSREAVAWPSAEEADWIKAKCRLGT